jgi:hypothetical protein
MSTATVQVAVLGAARQASREANLSAQGFCSSCHVRLPEVVRSAVRHGEHENCPNCLSALKPACELNASPKLAISRTTKAP